MRKLRAAVALAATLRLRYRILKIRALAWVLRRLRRHRP
jgi:hypothetical protein